MGRKLNISTPTVINTELVPLTTSFGLEPNGLTEQWYYENTNVFSPDRQITPLVITPRISAVDTDTNTSYTPVINNVQWVVQWWNGTQWVESIVTNNIDSFDEDYVIDGNTLIIHKNNADPTHSINIRCTATYRDPRDAGATYTAQESLSLTTDRDATVISPKIDVLSEPSVTFNPLKSQTSLVTLKGVSDWSGVPSKDDGNIATMKAEVGGTEEVLLGNEGEVVSCAPTLDILYGVGAGSTLQEDQTFTKRETGGGEIETIPQNIATIERIKGNTITFNQLASDDITEMTTIYCSFEQVEERTIKVTGNNSNNPHELRLGVLSSLSTEHIYYLCATMASGTTNANLGFVLASNNVGGNAYLTSESATATKYSMITSPQNSTDKFVIRCGTASAGRNNYCYFKDAMLIDLTEIFGAGNEITDVDEFEQWLKDNVGDADYYEQTDNKIVPVKMTGIKTTGGVGVNAWEYTTPIPITSIKGKLNGEGESVTIFPNGMTKCGSYVDEIYYDDEDDEIKAVARNVYRLLSQCTWSMYESGIFTTTNAQTPRSSKVVKIEGYEWCGANYIGISTFVASNPPEKSFCVAIGINGRIYIKDSEYTTIEDFRAAIQGKYYITQSTAPKTYTIEEMPKGVFVWYGVQNGVEVLIDTLPCYVSGQYTDTLTIDAMYGEQIPIILRIKEYSWSEAPYPPKVYRSVVWRVPTIDSIVVSENGEAVRSNSGSFTFDTVVNVLGETLSDEKKTQHLRFNWKSRKANATPQFGMTDRGWGQKVTIKASDLKNYKSSSIVTNDVYVLGAYEEVLLSNESVTLNGEKVYAREL